MNNLIFVAKTIRWPAVLLFCMIVSLSGCATILRLQTDFVTPMICELVDQAANSKNIRVVREGIGANALLVSGFSNISPTNRRLLRKSAYVYCAYGLMVEDTDPAFASDLYAMGKGYGLRALKMNSRFKKGLQDGNHIPDVVQHLGKRDLDAMVWTGVNTGLWIFMNMEDSSSLIELADAVALVQRSLEIDENYYFGLGKVFIGAYYALIPDFFGTGGGPEASAKMFAEARAVSNGRLLLVDVFEARFLDTQLKNREEYIRKLEHVLAADDDILQGYEAFTKIAKLKARFFLDHMDEYF
ncbi:MAG: TRAP transporter TatT component family protein [Thermodesulfobacteriota bacterium]